MPHVTSIPARDGLPAAELYTRISTPHCLDARRVDNRYPTVLFIHPLWTDSFFFYPQYEDPVFAEHFNLVAFDCRGHGMTTGDLPPDRTYGWEDVAEDCHAALNSFGVKEAHVVAVGSSAPAATHLACSYPRLVASVSLAAPAPRTQTAEAKVIATELSEALDAMVGDNNAEELEYIVFSIFDFHLDYSHAPQLRGVRADYVALAKQRLAHGDATRAVPFVKSLLQSRTGPSDTQLARLRCPCLLLNETQQPDDAVTSGEYDQIVSTINDNYPVSRPLAIQQCMEGPKWLTLASPNLVNPVLSSFLSTVKDALLTPPTTASTLNSPRPVSRRPSTPRDIFSFNIPPLPAIKDGTMTIGEAMNLEAKRREAEGQKDVSRKPSHDSVVNMTVEVIVTVDET